MLTLTLVALAISGTYLVMRFILPLPHSAEPKDDRPGAQQKADQYERELNESLQQQTATSEILRMISQSQRDVQPVLETIAASARKLCTATMGAVFTFDGQLIEHAASDSVSPEALEAMHRTYPMPPSRSGVVARSILDQAVVYISDVLEDPDYRLQGLAEAAGYRSSLSVPMLREGSPIGAISVVGAKPAMFTERQITMLKTFADQAVIAIENTRLFNELQEQLEQQTATAEILKVISSSPTDIKPVLTAVAQNAARLCGGLDAFVAMADGEILRLATSVGPFGKTYGPDLAFPITRGSVSGRAMLDRTTIHVVDLAAESEDEYPVGKKFQQVYGHRTVIASPLLRGGKALGVIHVLRQEVRPFTQPSVAICTTVQHRAQLNPAKLRQSLAGRNAGATPSIRSKRIWKDDNRFAAGTSSAVGIVPGGNTHAYTRGNTHPTHHVTHTETHRANHERYLQYCTWRLVNDFG